MIKNMKKIKHRNKNNKTTVDLKASKKIIAFGIIFGAMLIGLCIAGVYLLN